MRSWFWDENSLQLSEKQVDVVDGVQLGDEGLHVLQENLQRSSGVRVPSAGEAAREKLPHRWIMIIHEVQVDPQLPHALEGLSEPQAATEKPSSSQMI